MKKIAVLCSGGDSPGMNACIRSVFRACQNNNIALYGVRNGYEGLINNSISELTTTNVQHIIERGGTILGSSRSEQFMAQAGRKIAFDNLVRHEIEGLICIGGDGTFRGAQQFSEENPIQVIGIPGSI